MSHKKMHDGDYVPLHLQNLETFPCITNAKSRVLSHWNFCNGDIVSLREKPSWSLQCNNTILYLSYLILASSGGSQFLLHSQWASRKTITSPVEYSAPRLRVLIRPRRSLFLNTFTKPLNCFTYSSSLPFKCSVIRYVNDICKPFYV